jgi:EAL domain-containing protein (putative c-di-GMP-specific phosphodiesterase class I)
LLDIVKQALTSNEVEPRLLEMEMTETALMKESDVVYQQVSALRRLGVRVSLDDFGTGYSSLSYLSKFAFDKIKIDQSFVRSVTFDKKSEAIAMATMALAQSLGMDVIAEGVETIDQLRWLMATGCSEVQGYLISKPVPPETFEDICLSFHLGSIAI